VERGVIDWCKQLFGYPETASGILVSGASIATLVALTAARDASQNYDVRSEGVHPAAKLVSYASSEAHESVAKALDIIGLGTACLRAVPVRAGLDMDLAALRPMIEEDRRMGRQPFCIVGSAGTVNTGSIDDLAGLAGISAEEKIWFHVDGAFGALCVLNNDLRPLLRGIEHADSIAFDFHKWMHVQYDAGCVLIKSGDLHQQAFTMRPPYLAGADRGLAGGGPWFCDFGPELSRTFRALKVWFTMKEHGTARLGRIVKQNCEQARYLADRVKREPRMELLLEPTLNIVCFRFNGVPTGKFDLDPLNLDIVADLQESGIAAPSTTRIDGKLAIRVAITNHRSRREDLDLLVSAVVEAGARRVSG
jgi:glutamate/tyrosine decarboxylase-like PLP-dependent enzyme